ncbi:reverse transcriptase [Caerostris darwini]|uniref:Reverse transcriptase n=1 Tax=Caerostris darwini TaxID=1538125 RepID=A0AAV4Q529_9ARAC|nr:reverse transcriptase [Caerostris darwini]
MRKKILCMVCKWCEVMTRCADIGSQIKTAILDFSSKRNIRSCVSRCVVCKRFIAKALTTPPIQLPLDRVRESAIFEITGIDLCGPLLLKPRGKAWIVLFTCAVYRAIHLEPLTSLSTESFMQTLRRFIARRGRPSTVYTDNATNFRGTDNALKKIDWQKISENECYPIKWKFNPPTAYSFSQEPARAHSRKIISKF